MGRRAAGLLLVVVLALLAAPARGGMIKRHARRSREPVAEERRCSSVAGWCKCVCVADRDNGPSPESFFFLAAPERGRSPPERASLLEGRRPIALGPVWRRRRPAVGPGERNVEFRVRHGASLRCDESGEGYDVTFGRLRRCVCSSDTHVHHDATSMEFRQHAA